MISFYNRCYLNSLFFLVNIQNRQSKSFSDKMDEFLIGKTVKWIFKNKHCFPQSGNDLNYLPYYLLSWEINSAAGVKFNGLLKKSFASWGVRGEEFWAILSVKIAVRIQKQDRHRKAQGVYWKQRYTLEREMWANSEIESHGGSPDQRYLYLPGTEIDDVPLLWLVSFLPVGRILSFPFFPS